MGLNEKLNELKSKNKLFTIWSALNLVVLVAAAFAIVPTTGLVAGAGSVMLGTKILAGLGALLFVGSQTANVITKRAHNKEISALEAQIEDAKKADVETVKLEVAEETKTNKSVKKVTPAKTNENEETLTK